VNYFAKRRGKKIQRKGDDRKEKETCKKMKQNKNKKTKRNKKTHKERKK